MYSNPAYLPVVPELRLPIRNYNKKNKDEYRRTHLRKGPHQPRSNKFLSTFFGKLEQSFNPIRSMVI